MVKKKKKPNVKAAWLFVAFLAVLLLIAAGGQSKPPGPSIEPGLAAAYLLFWFTVACAGVGLWVMLTQVNIPDQPHIEGEEEKDDDTDESFEAD